MDKHSTHASTVLASFFKNTSVVPGGVADNCYEGIVWGDVPLNQRPSKEQFEARKAEMDRQIPMNLLRQERNSKLQSTDFLMTDSTLDMPDFLTLDFRWIPASFFLVVSDFFLQLPARAPT